MNLLNLINVGIIARPIFDVHTRVKDKINLIDSLGSAKYMMSSDAKDGLDTEIKLLKAKNLSKKEMAEKFANSVLSDFNNNLDNELNSSFMIYGSGSIGGKHNRYKNVIISNEKNGWGLNYEGLQINAEFFVMLSYIKKLIVGLALIYDYVKEEEIETKYIPLLLQMLGLGFGVLNTTTNISSDKKIIDRAYNGNSSLVKENDRQYFVLLQDKIEEIILKEFGRKSVISTLTNMFINKKTNTLAPEKFKNIFINFFENDLDKEIVYT